MRTGTFKPYMVLIIPSDKRSLSVIEGHIYRVLKDVDISAVIPVGELTVGFEFRRLSVAWRSGGVIAVWTMIGCFVEI